MYLLGRNSRALAAVAQTLPVRAHLLARPGARAATQRLLYAATTAAALSHHPRRFATSRSGGGSGGGGSGNGQPQPWVKPSAKPKVSSAAGEGEAAHGLVGQCGEVLYVPLALASPQLCIQKKTTLNCHEKTQQLRISRVLRNGWRS